MKTIEINKDHFIVDEKMDLEKIHRLMRDLYNYVLKRSLQWHFMIQPELIIRVEDEYVNQVLGLLRAHNYLFKVYDYPFGEGTYTLQDVNIDVQYPEIFLPIYHAQSLAALTLDGNEYLQFLERVQTVGPNMKFFDREKAARFYLILDLLNLEFKDDVQNFFNVIIRPSESYQKFLKENMGEIVVNTIDGLREDS